MTFEQSETTDLVQAVRINGDAQADAHTVARERLGAAERAYIREAKNPNKNRESMRRVYLEHETASRKLNTLNFLVGKWSRRSRATAMVEKSPA